MSTADSSINASVTLFIHDIAFPLEMSKSATIVPIRLATVLVGSLGVVLALYGKDLLYLLFLSSSFYLPIAGLPLLLAILGFRTSKRVVLIGMATGFTAVLLWRSFLAPTGIDGLLPATLLSLLALLSSHYLLGEPGGWQKVDPTSLLALERAARQEAWQKRLQTIKSFNLYSYLKRRLPSEEGVYTLLGFYAMARLSI